MSDSRISNQADKEEWCATVARGCFTWCFAIVTMSVAGWIGECVQPLVTDLGRPRGIVTGAKIETDLMRCLSLHPSCYIVKVSSKIVEKV